MRKVPAFSNFEIVIMAPPQLRNRARIFERLVDAAPKGMFAQNSTVIFADLRSKTMIQKRWRSRTMMKARVGKIQRATWTPRGIIT